MGIAAAAIAVECCTSSVSRLCIATQGSSEAPAVVELLRFNDRDSISEVPLVGVGVCPGRGGQPSIWYEAMTT